MKKICLLSLILLLGVTVGAQAPQAFKYQAVARDGSGNVLTNKAVSFRISILSGSSTGTVVYSEIHSGKTTNGFGLVDMEIGKGAPVTGSFISVAWYSGTYFLKVEMDPAGGSVYQFMGSSQLLSVPYALHAKNVELEADGDASNEIQALSLNGSQLTLSRGGGTVTLPAGGTGGDNWGTQSVITDGTLTGNGLAVTPLKIADNGITSIKIANGTVTTDDLADNAVNNAKIIDTAVSSNKLANNAVTASKLASMGATSGQVLTYSGTAWAPQNLPAGSNPWLSAGSDIYFNAGKVGIGKIPGADTRQFQVLTGTPQAIAGVNNSTLGTIFAQNNGTGPAADFRNKLLIADGTQGAGKVLTSDAAGYTSWQTPSVTTDASLAGNGTAATPLKLASFGASTGQILKWTGTVWDNAPDDSGPWADTSDGISYSGAKSVGIGINKPTRKLTIAEGGTSSSMNIQNASTGFTYLDGLMLGMDGINGWVSTFESGKLYLGTGGTSRMTIAADGDVGIGTTSPVYKLDVAGSVNLNKGITGQALLCNGAEAIWYDGTYFSWGYGGTWNYFKDAVGIDCQPGQGHMLAVNGVASKPGGGTWTAFSDVRLKNIHGDFERGLEDILCLHPVRFSYKPGNPLDLPSNQEYVGFIAQEVQKVFPETVTENKNGFLEFDIHGVNVALINAIKELKAENDLLRSRLEKIEASIGISSQK